MCWSASPHPRNESGKPSLPTVFATHIRDERRLLNTLLRIPRALRFANKHNLPHVIRIVGTNASGLRSPFLELLLVRGLDEFLQIAHHLVELLDCIVPLLGVEVIEGLVIVPAELLFRLALELHQLPLIPEQQMIGQLPNRMIPTAIFPGGLLGGNTVHRYIDGYEPVFLVMSSVQLLQQDASQRDGLRVLPKDRK